MRGPTGELSKSEYQQLEEFRFRIRRFLRFSEDVARRTGVEPQQHQALLVIHSAPDGTAPTIGYVAERLMIKHQSAVGLLNRLNKLGLISRAHSANDARQVLVALTWKGKQLLHDLSLAHRAELDQIGPELLRALGAVSWRTRVPSNP